MHTLKLFTRRSVIPSLLEPNKPSLYVTVANVMSVTGRKEDSQNARKIMKERGLYKEEGCTWIEVEGKVTLFSAHDRSHPQTDKIYSMLEEMTQKMKNAGYVPDTRFVLFQDDNENGNEKENEKNQQPQRETCYCVWTIDHTNSLFCSY